MATKRIRRRQRKTRGGGVEEIITSVESLKNLLDEIITNPKEFENLSPDKRELLDKHLLEISDKHGEILKLGENQSIIPGSDPGSEEVSAASSGGSKRRKSKKNKSKKSRKY
jgi:hypothetical protein